MPGAVPVFVGFIPMLLGVVSLALGVLLLAASGGPGKPSQHTRVSAIGVLLMVLGLLVMLATIWLFGRS